MNNGNVGIVRERSILDNPVDRQILAEIQQRNQKHIEELDFDPAEAGHVRIFNVGPKLYRIPLGGLGEFLIPACEEGKPYSKPLEILKMTPEGKNDDMQKMSLRIINGYGIAESLVGYGKFCNPSTDLRRFGVFTCGAFTTVQFPDNTREVVLTSEINDFLKKQKKLGVKLEIINTREVTDIAIKAARKFGDRRKENEIAQDILDAKLPTEAELEEANDRLTDWKLNLVREADEFYRVGNNLEIQNQHRWAAESSGNSDRPWVKSAVAKSLCNVCSSPLNPGQAICLGCKGIVEGMEQVVIDRRIPGYEYLWDKNHPSHKDYKAPAAAKAAN